MSTSVALFTARLLVDELARAGMTRACVAPGSRSTALALAVAERRDVVAHVLTDERSMGFFALGLARSLREPVALVCTSGTAAANLLPAAVEASLGGGALVLLTADRPPELRDCAAPQTIDQIGMFGSHARWAADVPILDCTVTSARVLRSLASRAAAVATQGEGGPVHLNVGLREPFVDASFPSNAPPEEAARADGRPFTDCAAATGLADADVLQLAERLRAIPRGVIVCAGRSLPAAEIVALASALGWPVLADPLSGLRLGDHDRSNVVDAIEPLLRDENLRAQLRPDAILRFGLTPASRSVQRWMEESWPAQHIVVATEKWPDPVRAASLIVHADAATLCRELCSALSAPPHEDALAWRQLWTALSAASRAALDDGLQHAETLLDGVVIREVVAQLPLGARLMVGNSMPVRDADAFLPSDAKPLAVSANRGASGIDGVLSTALGMAATPGGPVALVIGDLSFLHDATALVYAARKRLPILVVVVNNDGGGIFSYLPLHDALTPSRDGAAAFERFFGTPHGTDLSQVAALGGGFFQRVEHREELAAAVAAALRAAANGPAILEVRTQRDASRAAQQSIVRAAQTAAQAAAPSCALDQPTIARKPL